MNEWSFISQPGCQAELLSQLWWVEDKLEYEVPCDRTMHSREMPWRKRYYPTNKLLFGRRYFQKDYSEEDDVGGRRMKEMRSLCRSSETAQRQNVVGRKTLLQTTFLSKGGCIQRHSKETKWKEVCKLILLLRKYCYAKEVEWNLPKLKAVFKVSWSSAARCCWKMFLIN